MGFTKVPFINFAVKAIFILQKCLLGSITHFPIWWLPPHLRYNENGQFWKWCSIGNLCFDECKNRENDGTGEIYRLRPHQAWKMPYPLISQMIFNWSEYEFCISISNAILKVDIKYRFLKMQCIFWRWRCIIDVEVFYSNRRFLLDLLSLTRKLHAFKLT